MYTLGLHYAIGSGMTQKFAKQGLIKSVTTESIESLFDKLEAASKEVGFSVLGTIDIGEKLRKKGRDFDGECRIVEVCDPASAERVLRANSDIASLLPCRLAFYSTADSREVEITAALPSDMVESLGGTTTVELIQEAEEIDQRLQALVHSLASGANR